MKYIYVSPALPDSVFSSVLGYGKGSPGQQAQKYNKLLAEGISLCGRDLLMLSAPPIPPGSRPFKKIKISPVSEGNLNYIFLNVLDVPKVKNLYTYFCAKKALKRIAKRSADGVCLVCDLLTLSASLGALKAAKKLGIKSCGIVTDLPFFLAGRPSTDSYGKTYAKAVSLCGSFVLLTKQMAEALPLNGRPFVVIEGISTPAAPALSTGSASGPVSGKKFFFYAGGIEISYGVEMLVEAFLKANIKGWELLLCGDGTYAPKLSDIASKNSSVRYLGVISNKDVMELEKKASLLVNPRTSGDSFTSYSFPSKNIEYMSTGTPLIAYMLPGIPEEYGEYFLTPGGESVYYLSEKLKEAANADENYLKQFGLKAREFALSKKAPQAQAGKLLDMIEDRQGETS